VIIIITWYRTNHWLISNIIIPIIINNRDKIVPFILDNILLLSACFGNHDNNPIVYTRKKTVGNIASHIISIQRKNHQNSSDKLPIIRNSIIGIIQEQN
jgi:hypothetical protein